MASVLYVEAFKRRSMNTIFIPLVFGVHIFYEAVPNPDKFYLAHHLLQEELHLAITFNIINNDL